MAPASCSPEEKKSKETDESQVKEAELFQHIGKLQMELEWLKKISAALTLVSFASWSNTTIQSSASAGNAACWVCSDARSITGRHRCGNRRCTSWLGSILSTWRIPAAAAAGWWTTWPEKGFRSAAIGHQTSCGAWVYGRSIRSHEPRFQETHRSDSPVWWTSGWSRLWIRSRPPTSPTSRCRRDFSTWWRSWICYPETCSAASSPTALARSSVWMPWRWHWQVVASQRSSIPTRAPIHLSRLRGMSAGREDQDQLVRQKALLRQHPG